MKPVALLLAATLLLPAAPPSDWAAVQSIAPGTRVEVTPARKGEPVLKGRLVRADADTVVIAAGGSGGSAEQSMERSRVRKLKAHAPSRRLRNGLLGVAIGAGSGVAIIAAICPHCPNEGHFAVLPVAAAFGAAFGAIAFLPRPYRTVYQAPKR